MERAPVSHDHTTAFQEAFSIRDAHWFLGKASREMERYDAAENSGTRVDCLLNFASSLIALEDWTLPQDCHDEGGWRGDLRSESPSHAVIALIALVAKHRRLKNKSLSNLRIHHGQIHVWTEEARPERLLEQLRLVVPSARILTIRTHIDDDQIDGYTVIINVDGLVHAGKLVALEYVMREALAFWRARLGPLGSAQA